MHKLSSKYFLSYEIYNLPNITNYNNILQVSKETRDKKVILESMTLILPYLQVALENRVLGVKMECLERKENLVIMEFLESLVNPEDLDSKVTITSNKSARLMVYRQTDSNITDKKTDNEDRQTVRLVIHLFVDLFVCLFCRTEPRSC